MYAGLLYPYKVWIFYTILLNMLYRISPPLRPYTCTSFCRLKPATTILGRNLSFQRRKVQMIILSDTHGNDLKDASLPSVDVVLHCGDLTDHSRPAELERRGP